MQTALQAPANNPDKGWRIFLTGILITGPHRSDTPPTRTQGLFTRKQASHHIRGGQTVVIKQDDMGRTERPGSRNPLVLSACDAKIFAKGYRMQGQAKRCHNAAQQVGPAAVIYHDDRFDLPSQSVKQGL